MTKVLISLMGVNFLRVGYSEQRMSELNLITNENHISNLLYINIYQPMLPSRAILHQRFHALNIIVLLLVFALQ